VVQALWVEAVGRPEPEPSGRRGGRSRPYANAVAGGWNVGPS